MSVNDDKPSLRQAGAPIRDAIQHGAPVIGPYSGTQLMARTLGARVLRSPAPEVGWHTVHVEFHEAARSAFGHLEGLCVMQWHKEGFEPSPGAQRLASSPACVNQASALGPRSGMQFHVDAVEAKLGLRAGDDSCHQRRFQASHRSTVHAGPKVLAKMAACLAPPQAFACRLYARWLGATQAL